MNTTTNSSTQQGLSAIEQKQNSQDSKSNQRGFAAMDPDRRREIASKGGSIARRSRVKEVATVCLL